MTIRAFVIALASVTLLMIGCISSSGRRGGLTVEQVEKIPQELVSDYVLFSKRCSRCHALSRPINAPISSVKHWVAYVNRMRLNPGSGISPKDAERIVRFLDHWSANRDEILSTTEESK